MLLCLAKLLEFGRVQDIPSLFVGETVFVALYNHQPQRQPDSLKKKAYFTFKNSNFTLLNSLKLQTIKQDYFKN